MDVRKFRGKFAAFVPQLVYNSVQMEKHVLVSVKFIHKKILKMKIGVTKYFSTAVYALMHVFYVAFKYSIKDYIV